MMTLPTRDQFREAVFARDDHKCVVCGAQSQDAHHIMERRLFTEPHELGGYFVDNGVSVCGPHHIECEQTLISPDLLRDVAGIKRVVLPSHLYDDQVYDKWGNPTLPNGQRLRGELFHDESVQKVLAPVLHLFTHWVKYPRTHHLPWSPGVHDDDRVHSTTEQWDGKRVVVTLKMDGENTTMYRDHIHARSVDSGGHPSRTWVKNFWSKIAHDIPKGWRVCGENLFAQHSISYGALPSYFLGFNLWNEKNFCLGWDETRDIFELLGITPVEVLYDGPYSEDAIRRIKLDWNHQEGYVLRLADRFHYGQFRKVVGKFVRPDHIKTTKHWLHGQPVVPNKVAT